MQSKEASRDLQIPGSDGRICVSDQRAEQLLLVFSELECQEASMSPEQFSELLQHAALACGFADPAEACESLIGPALFGLQRESGVRCNSKASRGHRIVLS